jgi:hypothetical protein
MEVIGRIEFVPGTVTIDPSNGQPVPQCGEEKHSTKEEMGVEKKPKYDKVNRQEDGKGKDYPKI